MSELEYLQNNFQRLVLEGNTDFNKNIIGETDEFVNLRTSIYYDAYRLRLAGVLMADFPGLHTLMGDEQFHSLCLDYIKAYPSNHFSARYFGRHMMTFLSSTSPYMQQQVLFDMASFEWLVGDVLDAMDGEVFELEQLQEISPSHWPTITFKLHPSFRLLQLSWNTPKFWADVKAEIDPEVPQEYTEAVSWILWRKGIEVYYRSLKKEEAWVLQAVVEGKTFSEICEGLGEWLAPEEITTRVVGFLQSWLLDEMISSVEYSD